MKKLGFGLMRLPMRAGDGSGGIDMDQLCRMVDLFLERGYTYFDTAWLYCQFQSEAAVKTALVERYPRDRFTVATKLHTGFFNTLAERDDIFSEQLRKTGAGYFDYYLLHGVEGNNLPKFEALDCFSWLLEKRDRGLVRHAGFSYHDGPELLDTLLTRYPQMEFVQLQLNYLDWDSRWVRARECYEVCVKHGKPVVVMEPVKGGTLADLPPEAEALLKRRAPEASCASWALRFAAALPNVMVVLSGMSDLAQMEDNTAALADAAPLTEEENAALAQVAQIIRAQVAVPCTGCGYCAPGCPRHIDIPGFFSLYNKQMRERAGGGWTPNFTQYELLTARSGRSADCLACGQCEGVCPQHLPIVDTLRKVTETFGG